MKTSGNSVLITGGATGIGFALAEALMKAGNKVLICGRRENRLEEAKEKLPGLQIKQCDISTRESRVSFCNWVKNNYKDLNILINNAGIQRGIDLTKGVKELFTGEDEIQTNFAAPIHFSTFFAPLLMKKKKTAILNVSSGLGFVPIAFMPVYCATKAGLHLFTVSLRQQLKDTTVKVFEIIPPAVDSELGKGTTGDSGDYRGIPPEEVAKTVMESLKKDEYEIAVGEAKVLVERSRKEFDKAFQQLNSW